MLPFVTNRNLKQNNNIVPENFNYEISLLVMAKKVGLSFEELNVMTLQDFIDFIDMYIGQEEDVTKKATQEDIDRFYSCM